MSGNTLDRGYFELLCGKAMAGLGRGEHLFLNLAAESSQFVRITSTRAAARDSTRAEERDSTRAEERGAMPGGARVRQVGTVDDAQLEISLVLEGAPGVLRKAARTVTLKGASYVDLEEIHGAVEALRAEAPQLPQDPYARLPESHGSSSSETSARLPGVADAAEAVLAPLQGVDIAGLYAAGPVVRAMANSAGLKHWFRTETFSLDYSLYTPSQRAVKGTYAGRDWDAQAYERDVASAREKLALLEQPARRLERGAYRAYLAPAAYHDLVAMLSWGGVSESAIRQGGSPLRLLRKGERKLSPKFRLYEDFTPGDTPRFNEEGQLAPERLAVIENGELAHSLVSPRTAQEYGVPSTGASNAEGLRSARLEGGSLREADILSRLGTGLYLSNLHYLNWSDRPGGRITGMTRYACFWVENGRLIEPIESMRFDDSIFSLFGTALEELTERVEVIPDISSYFARSVGAMRCPGALVSEMRFTL